MNVFAAAAAALAILALAIRLAGAQHRLLHLLQIEHYESARLILWLRRRHELVAARELICVGALYAAGAANVWAGNGWVAGVLLLISTPVAALGPLDWRRPAAKPLVFTARAKRLLALALAPSALVAIAAIVGAALQMGALAISILLGIALLLAALAPYVLTAANFALRPVEAAVNRRFVASARQTLARVAPLVVGITGSYGKTSTKFCVGAVLTADRPTLVTPASFNSYLGVVRTINEHLRPEHRAFVAEMGMFRRGDIEELCELTHPQIGVITAIGPMHLERLGSIEAIEAAKAELMEALPADGRLITNADDPRCLAIASRAHVPVTLFGIDSAEAAVRAQNISFAGGRTELDVLIDSGQSIHVSAQLLGRHNVYNMLAAVAVGQTLGVPSATIARALGSVSAPEHRLAPIHNRAAGLIVIDDAYNSNPNGAAAALEVLGDHDAARRLLVTPGMVELGELEDQLNHRFGEQAAAVCDLVVLVGRRRTRPIYEGLLAGGMAAENVHVVADLAEATGLLGRIRRPGDVILFENDLPDTYAENGGGHQ
ncbi:MAG TPA: UDP-N-acetylmuramoyl-tripeptide--D-alanyl-D-alanine ligase [Solirubrobacteraceae bacterium]|nr:UDP-N-acetylmuramoyl-tripeptide--D-alanyl-D-alanine ligase [Solirubrobacteraceae bacterium]